MNRTILVSVMILVLLACGSTHAQVAGSSLLSATSERVTSTNYYYARPNDLTMIVSVLGFVERPGRYEIATSIDLVNLLSLAGGPTADGTLSKVTVTRLETEGGGVIARDVELDLEAYDNVKSEDIVLAPGDIVHIGRTSWSTFRDAFGVIVSAAILTSAVAQVINVTK